MGHQPTQPVLLLIRGDAGVAGAYHIMLRAVCNLPASRWPGKGPQLASCLLCLPLC
jgi:hypothetical protein